MYFLPPLRWWGTGVAVPLLVHLVYAGRIEASRIHHRSNVDLDADVKQVEVSKAQLVHSSIHNVEDPGKRDEPFVEDEILEEENQELTPEQKATNALRMARLLPIESRSKALWEAIKVCVDLKMTGAEVLEAKKELADLEAPGKLGQVLAREGRGMIEKITRFFNTVNGGHNGLGILQLDPDTWKGGEFRGGRIFSTATLETSTAMLNWLWYQNGATWPGENPLFEEPIKFGGAIMLTTGFPEGGYTDIKVNIGRLMKKGMENDMLPECCRTKFCYCQWLPKNTIPPEERICTNDKGDAVKLKSGHVYAYIGKRTNVNEAYVKLHGASLVGGENCSFVDLKKYNWTAGDAKDKLCGLLYPGQKGREHWETCSEMILCQLRHMQNHMNFPDEDSKDPKDENWFTEQAIAIPKMGQIETKLFTKSLSAAVVKPALRCEPGEASTTPAPQADKIIPGSPLVEQRVSDSTVPRDKDKKEWYDLMAWDAPPQGLIHKGLECSSKCDGKRGECDYCGKGGLCCQDPGYGYWWTLTYHPEALKKPCGTRGEEHCVSGSGEFCCVPKDEGEQQTADS